MAPIDNGEEKIERVSSEIARSGGQAIVRVTMRLAGEASKVAIGQTLRAGEASVRRMAQWATAAVTKPGGQVSMKELSELPSRTGREVVSLDDKDVMQALEKNLKGRGVHYAIEREKIDGKIEHILHVRGDDAQVVADSLERSAEAVDAKRERKQERVNDSPKLSQEQEGRAEERGKPDDPDQIKEPTVKEAREWHRSNFPDAHSAWEQRRSHADTGAGRSSDDRELVRKMHRAQKTEAIIEKGKLELSPEKSDQLADALHEHAKTLDASKAQRYTALAEHVKENHSIPATQQDMSTTYSALDGAYEREVQRTGDPFSLGRSELSDVKQHSEHVALNRGRQLAREQAERTPDSPQQQAKQKPAEKRSNGDTTQKPKEVRQREIREKVKARAEKIKTDAPKPTPKIDAPTPRLKR